MLTHPTASAIVIGGGSGNGLGIARNLGAQGIPVYCVTSNPREVTCVSRYCVGTMIVPHVERDPVLLRRVLMQLAHRLPHGGVLFPTTDTAVLSVAQIRDTLTRYVTTIPDQFIVETMVNKAQFYPSLQKYDVPHPRTLSPLDISVNELIQQLSLPIYIRPALSSRFHERYGRKGFIAQNAQDLSKYLAFAQQEGIVVLVQEVIPGPATEGYIFQGYLDQHSQPIVIVAAQKIRQPTMFSNESIEITIPSSDVADTIDCLVNYFQRIGYRGLFGAEFKRDPRDGVFKLLEVNPRSMGGVYINTASGANDVLAAYREALGETITLTSTYQVGLYFIDVVTDLEVILAQIMQRELTVQNLLYPYLAPTKAFNIVSREDPLPFVMEMRRILHQLPARIIASRARI